MSKYKMVALDLDGTLLNNKSEISQKNIEILRSLHQDGIEIIIATGRTFLTSKQYGKILDLPIHMICSNGAIIKDLKEEKTIYSKSIKIEETEKLLKFGIQNKINVTVYEDSMIYLNEKSDFLVNLFQQYEIPHMISKNLINKIERDPQMVIFRDYMDNIAHLEKFIKEEGMSLSLTHSTPHSVEIMADGVNKYSGVSYYAKMKGIKNEEIITMGNSMNDYEMLKYSGLGIAMKNSDELLLEKFSNLSEKDNDENGVYEELYKIFYN